METKRKPEWHHIKKKIDFKVTTIMRERRTLHNDQWANPKRRHTVVNIYASNIRAPQYIRQTLAGIRGKINSNTIIVGDFSTNGQIIKTKNQ